VAGAIVQVWLLRGALRALLASGQTIVAPGAFDPLSARLVEEAGFSAVYAEQRYAAISEPP
jgi:2-methylisocitrate lyase-like PEP mutase family enzyme